MTTIEISESDILDIENSTLSKIEDILKSSVSTNAKIGLIHGISLKAKAHREDSINDKAGLAFIFSEKESR